MSGESAGPQYLKTGLSTNINCTLISLWVDSVKSNKTVDVPRLCSANLSPQQLRARELKPLNRRVRAFKLTWIQLFILVTR
jgi:hypothetical protein